MAKTTEKTSQVGGWWGAYPGQIPVERLISGETLVQALEDEQLSLYYQPKVEMKNGKVVGLEALLRWHHTTRGLLTPELFIPIAERDGVIRAITRWVLETVIRQCACWRQEGLLIPIAVNLSGLDLEDRALPDYVAGLLETWQVPPHFIELEITETAAIADLQCSLEVLGSLSRLGLGVAIDDFGIGYSSLQRLKQLPFTTIKIDKTFVSQAGCNEQDMVFIDTITRLGHRLGLTVVAEGIECAQSWARLAAAGCDMGQGYHISRPLSCEAMSSWLRSGALHDWRKIG
jgi:EAL domain-containing protein (putative c-di-GMP-specific phosphodiesterase class I)